MNFTVSYVRDAESQHRGPPPYLACERQLSLSVMSPTLDISNSSPLNNLHNSSASRLVRSTA